jgi:hypothetical protein
MQSSGVEMLLLWLISCCQPESQDVELGRGGQHSCMHGSRQAGVIDGHGEQ